MRLFLEFSSTCVGHDSLGFFPFDDRTKNIYQLSIELASKFSKPIFHVLHSTYAIRTLTAKHNAGRLSRVWCTDYVLAPSEAVPLQQDVLWCLSSGSRACASSTSPHPPMRGPERFVDS
jgi:hypothetical protein